MGNMTAGYELVAKAKKKRVYALTLPLITSEGGKKFGKSLKNAIWLSPEKSSSFQLYQYLVRTEDADVERFLKYFTFLPLWEIKQLMERQRSQPDKREAQLLLAEKVTTLIHGGKTKYLINFLIVSEIVIDNGYYYFLFLESGLQKALQATDILYSNSLESLVKLSSSDLLQVFDGAKVVEIPYENGITISNLVKQANCFKSDHDAKLIIDAGGFYVNYQKITNSSEMVVPGIHILPNNLTLLRVGKKNYHVIKWK